MVVDGLRTDRIELDPRAAFSGSGVDFWIGFFLGMDPDERAPGDPFPVQNGQLVESGYSISNVCGDCQTGLQVGLGGALTSLPSISDKGPLWTPILMKPGLIPVPERWMV